MRCLTGVAPILFVVAQTIAEANDIEERWRSIRADWTALSSFDLERRLGRN